MLSVHVREPAPAKDRDVRRASSQTCSGKRPRSPWHLGRRAARKLPAVSRVSGGNRGEQRAGRRCTGGRGGRAAVRQ